MRTPLPGKPLHWITIVILFACGALYLHSDRLQQRHDANARAYLQQALTDIGSWQAAALRRQFAAETNAAVSDAQIAALLERYRPLGPFKILEEPQFARLPAALSLFSGNTLLSYSARARFAQGSAQLTATLILRDNRFYLYNFNLSEPVLNTR